MTRPNDTSPEAERVLREVYWKMPFATRWQIMGETYQTARVLHAAGARLRLPGASAEEIARDWARINFGEGRTSTMKPYREDAPENLEAVVAVVTALTRLAVPHALAGSWASSFHGKIRFTHDADFIVEPFPGRERAFRDLLGDDYRVNGEAGCDLHIIHFASSFKVDVFVRKDRPFEQSVMARRREWALPGEGAPSLTLISPEDSVLLKLEWFRIGGEASEQQWRDVLGVLEVQQGRLDDDYLDRWAGHLGVADLLARARQESLPG